MCAAWREAASQSWTAARILPRCDRRLARPVVAGDQQQDALAARDRPLERRGRSPARRCRDSCREGRARGRARPRRSAAACPSCRRGFAADRAGLADGGAGRVAAAASRAAARLRRRLRLRRFSRSRRRLARATAAGSSRRPAPTARASSGLSERTRRDALGQQDQRLAVGRHAARDRDRLGARAPEGVEAVRPLDRAAGVLRDPQAVASRPVAS